jgi:hypothetical protein
VEALAITDPTLLNIVLMLVDRPGKDATAATATKAAINAYSIMS